MTNASLHLTAAPDRSAGTARARALRIAVALLLGGLLAFGGAIASLLAGSPEPAGAATFTVTSNADGGPGTLREAINNANVIPGPDVITIGRWARSG